MVGFVNFNNVILYEFVLLQDSHTLIHNVNSHLIFLGCLFHVCLPQWVYFISIVSFYFFLLIGSFLWVLFIDIFCWLGCLVFPSLHLGFYIELVNFLIHLFHCHPHASCSPNMYACLNHAWEIWIIVRKTQFNNKCFIINKCQNKIQFSNITCAHNHFLAHFHIFVGIFVYFYAHLNI